MLFFSQDFPCCLLLCSHSAPIVLTLPPFHFLISILILSFHLHLDLPSALFPTGFSLSHKTVISVLFYPCSAHPIHLSLLTAMAKCTNHEDPHYGSSLILLSLSPSFIQLSSSEIHSRKSTVYILPSTRKTQYDNHTEQSSFEFGVI